MSRSRLPPEKAWPAGLPDDLPRCFARLANMTARAVNRHYNAAMRVSGLQVTQLSILVALRVDRWSSLTALAEDLGLERTTLLRNLALLERDGLIAPSAPVEGHRKRLRLTTEGQERLDAALPHWRRAQDVFIDALGQEQAGEIGRALTALRRIATSGRESRPAGSLPP